MPAHAALSMLPGASDIPIDKQALYYDDAEASLSLAHVLAAPPPPRRLDAPVHWLRLPLVNTTPTAGRWVLALGLPDVEYLDAYQVTAHETLTLASLSPAADFAARPIAARLLAIPFTLAPGAASELVLRYQTHLNTPLTLRLLSPERFQRQVAEGNLINGAILGVLLALLLSALLQYFATGETAFLAYTAMVAMMGLFLLQFEGYAFEYLWPTQGLWNQMAPKVLAVGIHITHALFAVALFDLRQRSAALYRIYLGYIGLTLLGAWLHFQWDWVWHTPLVALAYPPLVLASGVYFLRRGWPGAGLFLAGATTYTLFNSILFILTVLGLLRASVSPFVYPKIGYVCEALCFALALAHQVQALRRRVEDGLRRHLAEAEQLARIEAEKHRVLRDAQQQQLQLAAAGHDLSQPLASIRFALATVQNGNEAATRHIDHALDYTESLLRSLIDAAKRGQTDPQRTLCLENLLAEAQRRHLAAAQNRGLRLDYHPTGYRIAGSARVLERILDNLLGNAIRYTGRGRILLGVRRRADGLEIQVLDTGPGIDPARRRALLAPFAQSGRLAAERLGHGLGLYIVKTLCEQSGYRLTIRSTPGRGSSFGIWLPFER